MIEKNSIFLKIKKNYLNFLYKEEKGKILFYDKVNQLKNFYIPICDLIFKKYLKKKTTIIIGLSGGQGSGKTTIGKILKIILKIKFGLNVVCFSLDDFYKTLSERKKMSQKIHKLFLTRGVPGTHDTKLLKSTLLKLKKKNFKSLSIPVFDKSKDDRKNKKRWLKITKKPEIIIFEGWCLGAINQKKKDLIKPINTLERKYDKQMIWRNKVNYELKNKYMKIFKLIDKLIFLKVPNFKYVLKWRILQEKKLKLNSSGKNTMSPKKIKEFVMHYERTSKQMIRNLDKLSNITISLDRKHRFSKITLN